MIKGQISVIMSVYNCEDTLRQSIESILCQTYTNWKFIICDDCSTDNTSNILEEYANIHNDKIIVIKNEKNLRLPASLNRCLQYADGEFIARMDGDDISLPERFEKQIEYLKTHPEYDLVGTSMQRFSDIGIANVYHSAKDPDYYTLHKRLPFCHATILARREVYDVLEGYTVSKRTERCEDLDLWFRFYHKGFKGNNLEEPLYMVREDINAIKRRTFKTRINAIKTRCIGYKLLKYPKSWLIAIIIKNFSKALVPYGVIALYRKWQSKHK